MSLTKIQSGMIAGALGSMVHLIPDLGVMVLPIGVVEQEELQEADLVVPVSLSFPTLYPTKYSINLRE